MKIALSDHFTYKKIFKISIAPILMMILISTYSIVDGVIISNVLGSSSFAGVNLIFPITMIVGGFGFMFGTGGAALTGKRLGEKDKDGANNIFTNMIIVGTIVGLVLSLILFFLIRPIANAMGSITHGSTQEMVEEAIKYGQILAIGQFAFILQNMFHSFFVVDEKPGLGFIFSLISGLVNIIFDLIFMIPCKMGVTGAAIATVMGFLAGGGGSLIYFIINKKGNIRLIKPKFEFKGILKCSLNGFSEFLNQIASAVVSTCFNIQLLKYFGQMGVEAYGLIQYVILIFVSIFIGYAMSMSPVVSYHYGAKNKEELHSILKKSFILIIIGSIIMMLLGIALARPLSLLFFRGAGSEATLELSIYALRVWSIHFLFCGFCICLSSFFTALNNGLISALIAIIRTFVMQIACVFILPLIFNNGNAIWWSAMVAEFLAMVIAFIFLYTNKKKYGYFNN